jgi:hypothetical protein
LRRSSGTSVETTSGRSLKLLSTVINHLKNCIKVT